MIKADWPCGVVYGEVIGINNIGPNRVEAVSKDGRVITINGLQFAEWMFDKFKSVAIS